MNQNTFNDAPILISCHTSYRVRAWCHDFFTVIRRDAQSLFVHILRFLFMIYRLRIDRRNASKIARLYGKIIVLFSRYFPRMC